MSHTVAPTVAKRRPRVHAALLFGAVLTLLFTTASPAIAGGSDAPPSPPPAVSVPGGYRVDVVVTFSGDGVPKGRSHESVSVSIPVLCWWTGAPGAFSDLGAMLVDYDSGALADATYGAYGTTSWSPMTTVSFPDVPTVTVIATPRSAFEQAAAAAVGGARLGWYVAVCRDGATVGDYCSFAGECQGMAFRTFALGAVPVPRVDPQDLAQAAMDYLKVPDPVVERNPKLKDLNQAAVVNLPTWFWVTNPDAVGAPTGTRTVTAAVGGVSATVVASTQGLSVSSPAGGVSCSPALSVVAWTRGASESADACKVVFTKASVHDTSGFLVEAKAVWSATWTSTARTAAGQTSGILPGLTRVTTMRIPVAEIQTITTLR
jgi:hypothetical protein